MQVMVGTFPDYVFSVKHKKLSLPELDQFITINKHLPGFEPAKYYETNSMQISEMMLKQQEKIEELTLYIIEHKLSGGATLIDEDFG